MASQQIAYHGNALFVADAAVAYASNSIPAMQFEVAVHPDVLGLANNGKVGTGVTGAEALFYILSSNWGGLGIDPDLLNRDSFVKAGEELIKEGNAVNVIVDSIENGQAVVDNLLSQMDAILFCHPDDGLTHLRLIRKTDVAEDTPLLNESNIHNLSEYDVASWQETFNEVRVIYYDKDEKYRRSVAVEQDGANIQLQGSVVSTTVLYPYCTDSALAQKLVSRELARYSVPLYRARIIVNRQIVERLLPGDIVLLSWSQYGIQKMLMRVMKIDYGTLTRGHVTIEVMQDRFSTLDTVFAAPVSGINALTTQSFPVSQSQYGWYFVGNEKETTLPNGTTVPIDGAVFDSLPPPIDITAVKVIDAPYWFVWNLSPPPYDRTGRTPESEYYANCVSRIGGSKPTEETAYPNMFSHAMVLGQQPANYNASITPDFTYTGGTGEALVGRSYKITLERALQDLPDSDNVPFTVKIDDAEFAEKLKVNDIRYGKGIFLYDNEFIGIFLEYAPPDANNYYKVRKLHRGLLGTVPQTHDAASLDAWSIGAGNVYRYPTPVISRKDVGSPYRCEATLGSDNIVKSRDATVTLQLEKNGVLGDTAETKWRPDNRYFYPPPPSNLLIDGKAPTIQDPIIIKRKRATLTWCHRYAGYDIILLPHDVAVQDRIIDPLTGDYMTPTRQDELVHEYIYRMDVYVNNIKNDYLSVKAIAFNDLNGTRTHIFNFSASQHITGYIEVRLTVIQNGREALNPAVIGFTLADEVFN